MSPQEQFRKSVAEMVNRALEDREKMGHAYASGVLQALVIALADKLPAVIAKDELVWWSEYLDGIAR